jgi:hypothetical protein
MKHPGPQGRIDQMKMGSIFELPDKSAPFDDSVLVQAIAEDGMLASERVSVT